MRLGCRGNARTGAENVAQIGYERHQQDQNVKIVDRPGMSLDAREAIRITEKSIHETKEKKPKP